MGRYILKQPNGLYCVWSSIIDAPVVYNATKEELYEKDYLHISSPTFGEYLKADVDYSTKLVSNVTLDCIKVIVDTTTHKGAE